MINLHIFGGSTNVGNYLTKVLDLKSDLFNLYKYSRKSKGVLKANLKEPDQFFLLNTKEKSIIISFAPIWHFAKFINYITKNNPKDLENVLGIIIISSTSATTKRFAFNNYDKELVKQITKSEKQIINNLKENNIKLKIIRPTLIYGNIKNYNDRNINKIIRFLSIIPIVFLPRSTGKRQPIHAKQLAEVTITYINKIKNNRPRFSNSPTIIEVGGDQEISYHEMLRLSKDKLPLNHKAKNCKIILIPNTLFYILLFPIFIINKKFFEAILRIQSDLCGFTPSFQITNNEPREFPLEDDLI